MALPDSINVTQGTAVVWGEDGGTSPAVGYTLLFNGLANGSGTMGDVVDLGANFQEYYAVYLRIETGTAPTAGNTAEAYLVTSHDNSFWAGEVTGTAAGYPVGTSEINLRRLGAPVCSLSSPATGNTTFTAAPVIWRSKGRYVVPVIFNRLGQALRSQGTPANNTARLVLVPLQGIISE